MTNKQVSNILKSAITQASSLNNLSRNKDVQWTDLDKVMGVALVFTLVGVLDEVNALFNVGLETLDGNFEGFFSVSVVFSSTLMALATPSA